jgi:hypothetical protein
MHIRSFLYTTALLCFPKNLIPWWDSNPDLLVPEADGDVHCATPPGLFRILGKKNSGNPDAHTTENRFSFLVTLNKTGSSYEGILI